MGAREWIEEKAKGKAIELLASDENVVSLAKECAPGVLAAKSLPGLRAVFAHLEERLDQMDPEERKALFTRPWYDWVCPMLRIPRETFAGLVMLGLVHFNDPELEAHITTVQEEKVENLAYVLTALKYLCFLAPELLPAKKVADMASSLDKKYVLFANTLRGELAGLEKANTHEVGDTVDATREQVDDLGGVTLASLPKVKSGPPAAA